MTLVAKAFRLLKYKIGYSYPFAIFMNLSTRVAYILSLPFLPSVLFQVIPWPPVIDGMYFKRFRCPSYAIPLSSFYN